MNLIIMQKPNTYFEQVPVDLAKKAALAERANKLEKSRNEPLVIGATPARKN
jgi:hypothetical protein